MLEEAHAQFEAVLRRRPDFAEAHCQLGIVCHALGRIDAARAALETSLRFRPGLAAAHAELGDLAREQGDMERAIAAYERALTFKPDFAAALNNLAVALREAGRLDESAAACRRAIALDPNCAMAYSNLGLVLADQQELDEALAAHREAVRLCPDSALLHNALGAVLERSGRYEEALGALDEALRLAPDLAVARSNRGGVLKQLGRHEEAIGEFEKALALDVNSSEMQSNLGGALQLAGRSDEARDAYQRALALAPNSSEVHENLGGLMISEGRFDAALAHYDAGLRVRPERASAHHNRALTLLSLGEFAAGWDEFEWRWQVGKLPQRPPLPEWDGAPLAGRTILLYFEQGAGDTLQFVRYAPMVKARGGSVVLAVPERLKSLLSTCPGVDRFLKQNESLAGCDVQAALMGLPRIFKTDLETIPADVPYLSAEAQRVEHWRAELASKESAPAAPFRVGIGWQGNREFSGDRFRSIPLAEFAPLAAVEGVRLVSLQKGFGSEQVAGVDFAVEDLADRLDETGGAFWDTAAVIKNLDLVVTSDTSLAHLGGALAAPTWVALPFSPDWRWLLERSDSPWYPTMRLFRQAKLGQWSDVFQRIAAELAQLVAARTGGSQS